jgi:hypothetical protein
MNTYLKISLFFLIPLFSFAPSQKLAAQPYDLTGTWQDDNGTTYILRQINDNLFWSMDSRPGVHNVFYGVITGNMINGQWADLPDGQKRGNGNLVLNIESNDRFKKISQSGNYGAGIWTRAGTSDYPPLGGVWYAYYPKYGIKEAQCHIIQQGGNLTFINEKGAKSNGTFENDSTVKAVNWEGGLIGSLSNKVTLPGTVKNVYTRLDWANGSYWLKLFD